MAQRGKRQGSSHALDVGSYHPAWVSQAFNKQLAQTSDCFVAILRAARLGRGLRSAINRASGLDFAQGAGTASGRYTVGKIDRSCL